MQLPYSGLKIVHEMQVQEALERQRYSSEEARRREGVFQTLGKMLGRFSGQSHQANEVADGSCAVRPVQVDAPAPYWCSRT